MDKSGKLHIVEVGETEIQGPEQPKDPLNPPATEGTVKPAATVEKEAPAPKGAEQPTASHTVPAPESWTEPSAKPSFSIYADGKWYRV